MDQELLIGMLPQVLLDGLILGFMYALIALGYTMVYGVLEFINFAHSEIFILGAFIGVEILLGLQSAGVLESLPWPLVLLLVLGAGMAASALLAVTVERVAYRPLRHAPRLIPLISAIGVSFFLQDLIRFVESLWRNAFNLVYPSIGALDHRFELTRTLDVSVKSLVVIVAALAMLGALHALVNRTKVGTAMRAVAEDQVAANLMGVHINRIISLTFLIGGAMGAAPACSSASSTDSSTRTRASSPASRRSRRRCSGASATSRGRWPGESCSGSSRRSPPRTCPC